MKLWIDDVRPAPEGYIWIKSVRLGKWAIEKYEYMLQLAEEHNLRGRVTLEVIDIDHDAGDYASDAATTSSFLTGSKKLAATILFVSTA